MPENPIVRFVEWRRERRLQKLLGKGWVLSGEDEPIKVGCSKCFGWSQYEELKLSAVGNKCVVCRVVYRGMENFVSPYHQLAARAGATLTIRVDRNLDTGGDKKLSVTLFDGGEGWDAYTTFEFFTQSSGHVGDLWTNITRRTAISGNTSSLQAQQWLQDRLQRCLSQHTSTCPQDQEVALPTRILDIRARPDEVDESTSIRLLESNGQRGRYCCLSHCWGRSQPITTTKATLIDRKQNIMWASLPKTFQDAIVVARRLHIPYIWIDSLCIVQDDEQDWGIESQKMFEVYANCILTIAATASDSGLGGCFRQSEQEYRGISVDDEHDGRGIHISVRKRLEHEWYRQNMRLSTPLPLLSRGWVLQERLLAPRVVHFGPQELFWECAAEVDCECGTAIAEERSWKGKHKDILAIRSLQHGSYSSRSTHGMPDEQIADYWRKLVVTYCRMRLTYESDRLPAFQGITHMFKQNRPDEYLYGVWSGSLMQDLTWHVFWTETARKTKRGLYPSWSWMSVNSPIEYLHMDDTDIPTAKEHITILSRIKSQLVVVGKLAKVKMHYVHLPGVLKANITVYKGDAPRDRQTSIKYSIESGDPLLQGEKLNFEPDYTLEDNEQEQSRQIVEGQDLFCLRLLETPKWIYSWVLQKLHDQEYERIGIVRQGAESVYGGLDLYRQSQAQSRIVLV